MKNMPVIIPQDNDPLKIELLAILKNINESQKYIINEIKQLKKSKNENEENKDSEENIAADAIATDNTLKLFVHDDNRLQQFITRLNLCNSTKEWAVHAVYPLYEEEYLTVETIHNRRFIEATIPFCHNIKKANYDSLRKQLRHCEFPK